jgi:ferrous iron transport protein A
MGHNMKHSKSLIEMRPGEEGSVAFIKGGMRFQRRLNAMGIILGIKLRKISDAFLRGPVTVKVGNGRIAIGFGMAARIFLQVEADDAQ